MIDEDITETKFKPYSMLNFIANQAGIINLCFQVVAFFLQNYLGFSQLLKFIDFGNRKDF